MKKPIWALAALLLALSPNLAAQDNDQQQTVPVNPCLHLLDDDIPIERYEECVRGIGPEIGGQACTIFSWIPETNKIKYASAAGCAKTAPALESRSVAQLGDQQ